MAKALLISVSRLVKDTGLNGSIDNDLAHPYIQIAQDREIWPYIGTDLYNKIKTDITTSSVTGVYETLLEDYIQPALVQFAFYEVLPFLRVRLVNNSATIMSSEQSSPATRQDIKPLMDRAKQIGEFYRERMIEYLIHNSSLYPEYTSNQYPDIRPRRQSNYTGGMNLTKVYSPEVLQHLRDAGLNI